MIRLASAKDYVLRASIAIQLALSAPLYACLHPTNTHAGYVLALASIRPNDVVEISNALNPSFKKHSTGIFKRQPPPQLDSIDVDINTKPKYETQGHTLFSYQQLRERVCFLTRPNCILLDPLSLRSLY
jgi:hypothetical protein